MGGFVAGEGCFRTRRPGPFRSDGSPRRVFVFDVQVAQRDRPILEALRNFLGVGSIQDSEPRVEHLQPISRFTVASLNAHKRATIPFAEQYLLASAKRQQFEAWRDELILYDERRPKRTRSTCSVDGCEDFVRGQGLCRRHYYRVTGY